MTELFPLWLLVEVLFACGGVLFSLVWLGEGEGEGVWEWSEDTGLVEVEEDSELEVDLGLCEAIVSVSLSLFSSSLRSMISSSRTGVEGVGVEALAFW